MILTEEEKSKLINRSNEIDPEIRSEYLIEEVERKVLAKIYDTHFNKLEKESLMYRVCIVKHKGKIEFFHNAVLPYNNSLLDWIGTTFNKRIESILNYALSVSDLEDGLHCLSGVISVATFKNSSGEGEYEATTRVVPTQYISLEPTDLPIIFEDPTLRLDNFEGLLGEYLSSLN